MSTLELGLIGNSRTSALIDANARIVWWCYPYFDSDPVCCELMDPDKTEKDAAFHRRRFRENPAIRPVLRTQFGRAGTRFGDNAHNVIEIIDFAPCFPMHDRLFTPSSLIRIIRRVAVGPASRFASDPPPTMAATPRKCCLALTTFRIRVPDKPCASPPTPPSVLSSTKNRFS